MHCRVLLTITQDCDWQLWPWALPLWPHESPAGVLASLKEWQPGYRALKVVTVPTVVLTEQQAWRSRRLQMHRVNPKENNRGVRQRQIKVGKAEVRSFQLSNTPFGLHGTQLQKAAKQSQLSPENSLEAVDQQYNVYVLYFPFAWHKKEKQTEAIININNIVYLVQNFNSHCFTWTIINK